MRSFHGRFGTWKLEVDGQIHYFQNIDDMKNWFKKEVKDLALSMMKDTLEVCLNFIPTESGQLTEAIYTSSQYGVVDWKGSIIIQMKVIDPELYVYMTTKGQAKTKKIAHVAHTNSKHWTTRAPATLLNNPLVHPLGQKGNRYQYLRDDPLARVNYLHILREYLKATIAEAILRIIRKRYLVHYYIKVSKTQYGKDAALSPNLPTGRKINILNKNFIANLLNPTVLDEYGTFLTLYTRP